MWKPLWFAEDRKSRAEELQRTGLDVVITSPWTSTPRGNQGRLWPKAITTQKPPPISAPCDCNPEQPGRLLFGCCRDPDRDPGLGREASTPSRAATGTRASTTAHANYGATSDFNATEPIIGMIEEQPLGVG